MLQASGRSFAQLAESLRRARDGSATDSEVVQWLRVSVDAARSVPHPGTCDPNRRYTRTLLHRSDEFEILVLHWTPGCASAIHDHGGARCWLAVADGTMGVENYLRYDDGKTEGYATIRSEGREHLSAGAVDFRQDDLHLHRCFTGEEPAVTLHVYARPIERFHAFDERAERYMDITSSYDAILTA